MDVRKKLVELLGEVQETGVNEIPAGFGCTREYVKNERVASHLIANGVTVQEDCKDCAEATQNCIVKLQEQIAELRSAQEWIPVTERLPGREGKLEPWESYNVVVLRSHWPTSSYDLCDAPYDEKIVTTARYDSEQKIWHLDWGTQLNALIDIEDSPLNGDFVTHWMPLPQPPKGE